jgi:hypothetical protein
MRYFYPVSEKKKASSEGGSLVATFVYSVKWKVMKACPFTLFSIMFYASPFMPSLK